MYYYILIIYLAQQKVLLIYISDILGLNLFFNAKLSLTIHKDSKSIYIVSISSHFS